MSADFYAVLGLDSDATQAEIESAFAECVRGLDPHSSDPNELHKYYVVKEAYDVLSNPNAKERYDFFNTNSIAQSLPEQQTSFNLDFILNAVTYNGRREKISLLVTVTFLVAFLFCTMVLLALKLDDSISSNWWVVLAPLWVLCVCPITTRRF